MVDSQSEDHKNTYHLPGEQGIWAPHQVPQLLDPAQDRWAPQTSALKINEN